MKKAVLFVFILICGINAFAQNNIPAGFDLSNYGVKIEPDKRLMTVLATLEVARTKNAAGEDVPALKTPLSVEGMKFREQLESDLKLLPADLRTKISVFVERYKKARPKATDAEIVAPFISMAYTLSPVPELADPVITSDLPGDLLDVLDFAPLVREFYRRSSFSGNLNDYFKTYLQTSDSKLRNSSKQMVSDLLDYLHTKPQVYYTEKVKTETQKAGSKKVTLQKYEERSRERRFYIVPEMLAPNGNINFLNIGDDYYAIVPPDTDLSSSEARRAFLQYVFDPLVLSNSKDILGFRPNIKTLLDERRKMNPSVSPDVYLAVSRSLVAAADARQLENEKIRIATAQARINIQTKKTDEEKRAVSAELEKFKQAASDETAAQLSEAYESGAVLAFYFADQLKGLEDSGFDIASSMRDMILSLDTTKETNRLEQFAEARKRAVANRTTTVVKTVSIENPVTAKLIEITKNIDAKEYAKAESELKTMLKTNPNEARVHYNLARVASLSAQSIEDGTARNLKLKDAQESYSKAVGIELGKQNPDRVLLSLSYVALAKIYEFFDETEYAAKIYDAAIRVGDISGGAYREALDGKARLLKNQ
ncbi:MAG: hypothetical protein LUM44_01930 [Pyrinomonadaceae bacterium]|nr:hypothetical protein [Pyrinomonadaceae bacterium]